jgi:hypothetical protein
MIPRLRILRTKSHSGIAIPLGAKRTVDGQTVEVLGLIKKQSKPSATIQWWIVSLEETNAKPPLFGRR